VRDEYVKWNLFNEYFASISNSPAYDMNKLPPFHFLTDHRLLPPTFDPFQVFRVLSSLHPNKCKGFDNLPNRILKICSQSLATPFSLLFNLILLSEVFPTSCKTATVIPIHKTASQTVVQNYRSIALLSSLSKVFEKLLHKHVYIYLEYHKLLIPNNSDFREKNSTLISLLDACHCLHQAYDSNLSSRIVFRDISKAFDHADHTCLIFKLQQLGIVGSLSNILSSYLFLRSQVILLGCTRSDLTYTNCGVAQGFVLGPLVFLIYVSDIAINIKASISLFADDTTLFYQISVLSTCTVCLLKIYARCTTDLSFGMLLSTQQNCGYDHI